MKPNIPLTNMTRQLKEMVELASSQNSIESDNSTYSSSTGYTKTGIIKQYILICTYAEYSHFVFILFFVFVY